MTQADLPPAILDDWITPDGARPSVDPAEGGPQRPPGDASFARAVLAVAPDATEGPIAMIEAGEMIVRAFIEAGAWALASIAVLLVLVLRRLSDVLLTLVPLTPAGVVTMEAMR